MNAGRYCNYKIVWNSFKLECMSDNILTLPCYMRIKPTNRCNHNCNYCVYDVDNSGMHEQFNRNDEMPSEILSKLIKNLHNNGVNTITFSGGGEPLLHPAIEYALLDVRELGFHYSIITNGQLLYGRKAECLEDASWVRISANYFDKGEFIKTGRGEENDFESIVNNIIDFANNKDKNCELSMNYIVTKDNCDTLFEAIKFWKNRGVETIRFSPVWVKDFNSYWAQKSWQETYNQITELKSFFGNTIDIQNGFKIQAVDHPNIKRCYFQEIVPVIGADCNIYTCHNSAYTKHGFLGSIKNNSFKDEWLSLELEERIKKFNPIDCKHQCAAGNKNLFIQELMDCKNDPFV